MAPSILGRALVVACAIAIGSAEAQEGTVPVTIHSASKKTELQIGAYEGDEALAWHHGQVWRSREICRPLCTTPCTLQLPPGTAQLCTAQSDIHPHHSADLNVPSTGADVWLRGWGGKPLYAGSWLWFSGALFATVGTGVLGAWGTGFSPGETSMVVGSVGLGLGGALLAVGIPLAAVYGREGVASMTPKAQISVGPAGVSATF